VRSDNPSRRMRARIRSSRRGGRAQETLLAPIGTEWEDRMGPIRSLGKGDQIRRRD